MKKRIGLMALVLVAVAVIAAVPILHAGPGRGMHGGGHGGFGGPGHGMILGHLMKIGEELDLTEAQRTQIHAILKETRTENAAFHEQLHGNMKSVAETLIANPNDVAGAQAILDRQAATEKALKTNILNAASKALNVLTPDQREKLADLVAEHTERMESRRK